MKEETIITSAGRDPGANHGIVNPPVYHASTIVHPTVAALAAARTRRFEPGVYTSFESEGESRVLTHCIHRTTFTSDLFFFFLPILIGF